MKKIILNKRQIAEIIGADFSYLDTNNDDFNYYNSNSEIVTSDQMDNGDDGEPLISDKIAQSMAPRYFYGHKPVRGNICCSKKKELVKINESNKDLENKTFKIPDELFVYLKSLQKKYQNNKDINGYKRLNNIITIRNLSTNEMYQLKNYFNNHNDDKSLEYNIIGGKKLKNWVEKELNNATNISYRDKDMKRNLGDNNAFIKPHNKEYGNNGAHSNVSDQIKNNVKFYYE